MPYYVGDSLHAIDVASKMPIGHDKGKYTDTNLQVTVDGEVCLHWYTAAQNGYRYIVQEDGTGRRPMTKAELKRPVSKWKLKDVKRWRRTAHYKKGDFEAENRPYTYEEAVIHAKKVGVIPCFELKSQAFASQPERAKRMKAIADKHGLTLYVMTLVTMKRWAGKMKAFHNAGVQTALLAHGAKKPATFNTYKKYITRVWGPWA